jgi:DHA2 family multidrug resistance protein
VSHLTPLDLPYQATLQGLTQTMMQRGADAVGAATQAQAVLYGILQRQATMLAFVDVFWLLAVVFLAVSPLAFLMKKIAPHQGPVTME